MGRPDVEPEVIERLRRVCEALPEAYEEPAWVGLRWRIRSHTFAHLVRIEDGLPEAFARAAGTPGPITVLAFRSSGEELAALTHAGPPYFRTPWGRGAVLVRLGDDTDWSEIAELVVESYRVQAPKRLAARMPEPPNP
jgi:hypothetical protein